VTILNKDGMLGSIGNILNKQLNSNFKTNVI